MSQSELFPLHAPLEAHQVGQAAARTTDPESSHEAAARMNASRQADTNRQVAIDLVWKYPGHTSRELAERPDCPLDRYELARRLPEAEALGEVAKGRKRKCTVAGTSAVTWIVPKQE